MTERYQFGTRFGLNILGQVIYKNIDTIKDFFTFTLHQDEVDRWRDNKNMSNDDEI